MVDYKDQVSAQAVKNKTFDDFQAESWVSHKRSFDDLLLRLPPPADAPQPSGSGSGSNSDPVYNSLIPISPCGVPPILGPRLPLCATNVHLLLKNGGLPLSL